MLGVIGVVAFSADPHLPALNLLVDYRAFVMLCYAERTALRSAISGAWATNAA